jgi:DnaA family protein
MYVTSTQPPASISFQLPDLRSRLLASSVHQLHELDEPGQVEALQLRARQRGLDLSDEAAWYLVHRVPRDMHSVGADRLTKPAAAQRRLIVLFLKECSSLRSPEVLRAGGSAA